ncbi:MAG TPA: hypothetical protein VGS19_08135 [Streptosporangiaceae bacterium]|nr:hypothetical protein [Streptosporangiaceae bacterium]
MITAAREAGHLAEQGDNQHTEDMHTLQDLGIEPHLAAYVVQLAQVPDEAWDRSV